MRQVLCLCLAGGCLCAAAFEEGCEVDAEVGDVSGDLLLQKRSSVETVKGSIRSSLNTVGWNGDTLLEVQALLSHDSLPAWAEAAKQALSREAERRVGLPAGLRANVAAGPWSVTGQGPSPSSPGTPRDYSTVKGYYWPCYTTCPSAVFGADKCQRGWVQADGDCDHETGLPWSKHDGFWNSANSDDLDAMVVMMDTVQALTLAWWFLPEHDTNYARVAVSVLRAWFFDETTGMLPRLLYADGIPGVYDGTAGGLIGPTFRLGTRLSDCVELLKTAAADVWSDADGASWDQWVAAWSDWLETSDFGHIQLDAVGNHATMLFSHKLAMARASGRTSIILDVVAKLRTDYAGSLAEQILPSGEMPHETARVTGATYSVMNLLGFLQLGEAVENACRGLSCSPTWAWSWEVTGGAAGRWAAFPDKISYCRYKGRGSTDSVEACQASCLATSECNGVVTRVKYGNLLGCYLKKCGGTNYQHRDSAPGDNVYTSYHYVAGAPVGSGSIRRALDFLLPYATGSKSWETDFPRSIDGQAGSWRSMALPLRIAANKFHNATYEADISRVDLAGHFGTYTYLSLLFPPADTVSAS